MTTPSMEWRLRLTATAGPLVSRQAVVVPATDVARMSAIRSNFRMGFRVMGGKITLRAVRS
jgi:hypothetical protein